MLEEFGYVLIVEIAVFQAWITLSLINMDFKIEELPREVLRNLNNVPSIPEITPTHTHKAPTHSSNQVGVY